MRSGRSRRGLEPLEMNGQAALRPVEAHATRDRRAVEHVGGLTKGQLLPGDEAKHLAIGLGEATERERKDRIAGQRHLADDLCQRPLGTLAGSLAVVVRERLAGHRVQPRQRLLRHLLELLPADQEDIGDDVLDCIIGDATPHIRGHLASIAVVDARKCSSRETLILPVCARAARVLHRLADEDRTLARRHAGRCIEPGARATTRCYSNGANEHPTEA